VLVEVVRSGMVESRHRGSVVGLGADGAVALRVGDVDAPVYGRSANKPLQATAMVELGLALPPPQLALVCASHNGQPAHVAGVRAILASAGLDEGLLQNTPAYPLHEPSAADVIRAGGRRAAILQNCSGKHAGMLVTCAVNGWPLDSYLDQDHPLQRHITTVVERLGGEAVGHVGIDGCGAPAHTLTLTGLARAFAAVTGAPAGCIRSSNARIPMRFASSAASATAIPPGSSASRPEAVCISRTISGIDSSASAGGLMIRSMPSSSRLSWASVTKQAISMRASRSMSSPVISQSIQTSRSFILIRVGPRLPYVASRNPF